MSLRSLVAPMLVLALMATSCTSGDAEVTTTSTTTTTTTTTAPPTTTTTTTAPPTTTSTEPPTTTTTEPPELSAAVGDLPEDLLDRVEQGALFEEACLAVYGRTERQLLELLDPREFGEPTRVIAGP